MQGSKDIIIIITTRNYPLVVWENSCKLERNIDQLAFNDKVNVDANECLYFKNLPFGQFSVFVAPCLVNDASDDVRRGYLEYIITTICQNGEKCVDYIYLFAHDADLGKVGNAIVTENDIPAGIEPVTSLSKLIKCNHVYRFKHEGEFKNIMLRITRYNEDYSKPFFDEDDCKKLVDIVDKEYKLRLFFQDINNDVLNRYPYIKWNTYE